MILYHITHSDNLISILLDGLHPSRSQGRRKVVWLCTSGQVAYMINHIANWKRCETYELIIIKVFIQRRYISKQRDGIWCTIHRIDGSNIDLI